jgi:hypothetical protein
MPDPDQIDTGKRVRDRFSHQWLSSNGDFVSDPTMANVFKTWREAFDAVSSISFRTVELVLKVQQDYLMLQVLSDPLSHEPPSE